MLIVSDTTPISSLYRIGQLHILKRLFGSVHIPDAVLEELQRFEEFSSVDWSHFGLETVHLENTDISQELLLEVDAGEAAAIAYYIERGADRLLIDDGDGRHAARLRKIKVIGTIGVLLEAKEAGLLPLLRPHLAALKNIQFYISDTLFRQALQLAGEL